MRLLPLASPYQVYIIVCGNTGINTSVLEATCKGRGRGSNDPLGHRGLMLRERGRGVALRAMFGKCQGS